MMKENQNQRKFFFNLNRLFVTKNKCLQFLLLNADDRNTFMDISSNFLNLMKLLNYIEMK